MSCNPKQLDSSKARAMIAHSTQERECHPLSCSFPRDLARNVDRQCFYRPQLDMNVDSHGELFPLQSPLLRESLLVSFPPLNYMLKFRGYSYRAEIRLENSKMIDIRYHLHATGLLAYDALCSTASIIQHVQGRIYQMFSHQCTGHACYPDARCCIHVYTATRFSQVEVHDFSMLSDQTTIRLPPLT